MATVLNAKGVPLPYSGSSTKHFSATNSGPQLFGTTYNDSIWGDANVTVTMYGGAGDDIYYLYSSRNKAVEDLNAGHRYDQHLDELHAARPMSRI